MSAVRTMWSLSFLSSLKAKFWALVKLGLGGWEDLKTLLTSALSSSASCWPSLVQVASMAVMYSKLGGCLGDTAKLGSFSKNRPLCWCQGLLDKLMTHFGLGSSGEDPWGSLFGGLGVGLLSWEPALSTWEAVLFPWEACRALCLAEHLGFCLPDLVTWLPAWPEGRMLPAWECLSPPGVYVVALLPTWDEVLSGGKGGTTWVIDELLPSPEGRRVPAWKSWRCH